jgi:hypothetical protein
MSSDQKTPKKRAKEGHKEASGDSEEGDGLEEEVCTAPASKKTKLAKEKRPVGQAIDPAKLKICDRKLYTWDKYNYDGSGHWSWEVSSGYIVGVAWMDKKKVTHWKFRKMTPSVYAPAGQPISPKRIFSTKKDATADLERATREHDRINRVYVNLGEYNEMPTGSYLQKKKKQR